MWCAHCQADVAAEVSPDTRQIHCATCGGEIAGQSAERTESRTRHARELLERWSRERLQSPFEANEAVERALPEQPAATSGPSPSGDRAQPTPPQSHSQSPPHLPSPSPAVSPQSSTDQKPAAAAQPHFRIDAPHATVPSSHLESPASQPPPQPANVAVHEGRQEPPPPRSKALWGAPLGSQSAGTPAADDKPAQNWVAVAGQWLAYSGVLGLMLGTCLVILGYYRGPAVYAPTGWLITMAGQMLLFLGVVTLVTNGMEENSKTVETHIARLCDRIDRLERNIRPPAAAARAPAESRQPVAERNPPNAEAA